MKQNFKILDYLLFLVITIILKYSFNNFLYAIVFLACHHWIIWCERCCISTSVNLIMHNQLCSQFLRWVHVCVKNENYCRRKRNIFSDL